ncbi:DUF6896 domain-containing protein [Corallococcus sicarius]|uniref:DUF6896 domain-containing protein n=1 Tax=Corallococcus sicarius TaxID=2316726 RepID=UPI0013157125|nr:hypothetical protein [Corallococcus sicarius]
MNAQEIIRQYSDLQASLVASLRSNLRHVQDWEFLTDVPKRGRLVVGDEGWRYGRHGAGVQFIGERTGRVVDAHVGLLRSPSAVDAWRLSQFCEAIGIATVHYGGRTFSAQDEGELELCLRELAREGILVEVPHSARLWLLSPRVDALREVERD